jgi:hypothetical protein
MTYLKQLKTFLLLAVMLMVVSTNSVKAQFLPNSSIPLDQNNGGRSITLSALKPGDIIVSTTSDKISSSIRLVTQAEVSHAILYIGNNSVIEAVEDGVTITPIEQALNKSKLAVAFRHPDVDSSKAKIITDFSFTQLGKKYNILGLLRHPRFGILAETCNTYSGAKKNACRVWEGLIKLATEIIIGNNAFVNNDSFFCSQLVADSYKKASIDLFAISSEKTSPGDIPILEKIGDLRYVGHLKSSL